MKWIKASERLPKKDDRYFCKAYLQSYGKIINHCIQFNVGNKFWHIQKDDKIIEWLDENIDAEGGKDGTGRCPVCGGNHTASTLFEGSKPLGETEQEVLNKTFNRLAKKAAAPSMDNDAHEKEIMMQAFGKVQELFEGRKWIMDGRGMYPYNDDRYQQEVRYMYDEFDAIKNDTWKNIKSKSFEYRNKIIEQYKKESQSPSIAVEEKDFNYHDKLFELYIADARNDFVNVITRYFPHEQKPDIKAAAEVWTNIRVAAEDILIAYDQMKEKLFAASIKEEGQNAIGFAEWVDANGYECILHTDENVKIWEGMKTEFKKTYTTEQLYKLFKIKE